MAKDDTASGSQPVTLQDADGNRMTIEALERGELDPRSLSLVDRLAWVKAQLVRFGHRDKVGGKGGYGFTSVDDIADVIRPLEAQAGIMAAPCQVTVIECAQYVRERVDRESGSAYQTVQWRTVLLVRWRVWCRHHGGVEDESFVESVGEALDTSDKSANKAQTAARKYMRIGLYDISTGEDPDHERPGDDGEQRTPRRQSNPADPPATPEDQEAVRVAVRRFCEVADDQAQVAMVKWLARTYRLEVEQVGQWVETLVQSDDPPPWPNALTGVESRKVAEYASRRAESIERSHDES